MSFSQDYLGICLDLRTRWRGKATLVGDWYLDITRAAIGVTAESELGRIRFSDDSMAYIPDVDDLLEMIDLQVQAWGDDPQTKKMDLKYEPSKGLSRSWTACVEYAGRMTIAVGESIHGALLNLYFQMAAPVRKKTRAPVLPTVVENLLT